MKRENLEMMWGMCPSGDHNRWFAGRRKVVIALVVLALSVSLITVLLIIPVVFGESFVSHSFELYYAVGPGHPDWKVVYVNGSTIGIVCLGIKVKGTNNYFLPVHIKYNGFAHVMLVYNRSVENPADVELNRDFLIWGGFLGVSWYAGEFDDDLAYAYYVSRKDLTNYTTIISQGY